MSRCRIFKWLTIFLILIFSECAECSAKNSGSCITDKSCVCINNLNEFVLHCEGNVHVTLHREVREGTFSCNNTISSNRLNRNYHSLLRLDSLVIRKFTFFECPQPSDSYASLFRSHSNVVPPNNRTNGLHYPIFTLEINCGTRTEFTIERKNFQGMNELRMLRILCPALVNLAHDLFFEPLPDLFGIEIIGTKITYIPEMLFSKLENLRYIHFIGNQVKMLEKNCLTGPKNLQSIYFSENKIEDIDDDIFYDHTNIREINLSGNYLNALPASLGSLHKLEILFLQRNLLRNFTLKDCSNLSSLYTLNLEHNLITEIDFECLSEVQYLSNVKVTGNNILKFPGTPVHMKALDSFICNHNSAKNIHLEKFLIANDLLEIFLSNSSITSVSKHALYGVPNLQVLDLSLNSIKSIPEEFFIHNLQLSKVNLQGNMLSELPFEIFKNNSFLSSVNLNSNKISILDAAVFARNSKISYLDISQNYLQNITEDFLFNFEEIYFLNLSSNHIKVLPNKLFAKANRMFRTLDLSHNMLNILPKDLFSPLNESQLLTLNLQDNKLISLPNLALPKLKNLSLAGNKLRRIQTGTFQKLQKLEHLNLSRNLIKQIYPPLFSSHQNILSIDLSSNELQIFPEYIFIDVPRLRVLNLSNNNMTRFILESVIGATGLFELNLTNNSMSFFGVYSDRFYRETVRRICSATSGVRCEEMEQSCPIKVLKLSNNKLNFNYTLLKYNEIAETWGRTSPLIYCKNVEEVYLSDNNIDEIFLDWRIDLPYLRLLDLRRNKFRYLAHQEQLFSTVKILEKDSISQYNHKIPMVIDLQENLISSIELPTSLLSSNSANDENNKTHRQISFLLGHNPFLCDCGLFNLLRVANNDASLTSEIERRTGKKWLLPAKLDTKDLRCWLPASLKGKKINEPEEWLHHILPMFGLCSLKKL